MQTTSMVRIRVLYGGCVIALMLMLGACGSASPTPSARGVPTTVVETGGSTEARIKTAYGLFAANSLPIGPQDAQVLSVKLGDGELGPSDYQYFVAIQYDPDSLQDWQSGKAPLDTPAYRAPQPVPAWWPDTARFQTLTFYSGDGIVRNGWIAVGEDGWLYAYAATT
jgi:hypothetical protein